MPSMTDSHWDCIVCNKPIMVEDGVSLDGTTELHVCRSCWGKLSAEEKLSQSRAWRETTGRIECLQAFSKLCNAAMGASALSYLTRGGNSSN